MEDELEWIRLGEHINFKLCILMQQYLNTCNCAPRYLTESIRPLSDDKSRLRSLKSGDVTNPRTKTKIGHRVAVPSVWNNLPGAIQATKTLPAFKKQLKLHYLYNSVH